MLVILVFLLPIFAAAQASPIDDLLKALQDPTKKVATTTQATTSSISLSTASTTSANDPRVLALAAQITSLQGMLAGLIAARDAAAASAPMTIPPVVSDTAQMHAQLMRNLARGSRGDDVKALQQFLIAQGLLAADSATGFFGALTEKAVRAWQKSTGIVSSGTAATTGYGAVGPKTRAAINAAMGNGTPRTIQLPAAAPPPSVFQPQCPLVPLPITSCASTWKEMKDQNGCTASWQCQ